MDRSWVCCNRSYIAFYKLPSQRFRKTVLGALRSGVGCSESIWPLLIAIFLCEKRCNCDYLGTSFHSTEAADRCPVCAGKMDGYCLTELLYACIGKCLDRAWDTSIVYYYINSTELLPDTFKHRINPGLVGNIYTWKNAQPAGRTRRSNYFL